MSKKDYCQEAHHQYPIYEQLLNGAKTFTKSFLLIDKIKPSSNEWIIGTLEASHEIGAHDLLITVEVSKHNEQNFKFRFDAKSFTPNPIIRFDALGVCHSNPFFNIPVSQRRVTTPHFHRYNEKGQCIAYKNAALRNPAFAKAWQDLNLTLAMFCQETKATCPKGNALEATQKTPPLPFGIPVVADPLDNLTFEA